MYTNEESDLYYKVRDYRLKSSTEQTQILQLLFTDKVKNYYRYGMIVALMLTQKIPDDVKLSLFKCWAGKNSLSGSSYYQRISEIVSQACELKQYATDVREEIVKSKHKQLHQELYRFFPWSDKEEEIFLRSLNGCKNAPFAIYEKKYIPNPAILKNLAPIMRLNVMEALLSRNDIGYNMLAGFKDEDEFRSLLFGSVMRYTDRVDVLCQKYKEINSKGIPATVIVSGQCAMCGEYSLSINTSIFRTRAGLEQTRFGRIILGSYDAECPFCGKWGQPAKQVMCGE